MKIAVTGCAGVVGRALRGDLARDHDVVGIDLRDADVLADVSDLSALERAFDGCDAVVHLAGNSSVHAPWDDVLRINIGGTYNVFEAARRQNLKHVIFASSNHVVGMYEVERSPELYREGAGIVLHGIGEPFRADSLYGAGKAFGEVLGRYYSEEHGLCVACIRIGSIVEPDRADDPALGIPSFLPHLTKDDARIRYAATWMSKRDFARLVRAILQKDVPYAVVYGVGDNATRFWDLEPGRAIYGFWPLDGVRAATPLRQPS